MKVLGFNQVSNTLRLVPESFDDLYLIARIVEPGDKVESKSYRRFKPSEGDVGEQKEVRIKVRVEKTELDKNSDKLRISGKIISGKPEEFISIGSYHTLNVGTGEAIDLCKEEFKEYVLGMVKQAVAESKKPILGIIAVDDEKATCAYVRGYGIDMNAELYSGLSKRMKTSDYEKMKEKFFLEIIKKMQQMKVDMFVVAGPGFMKDNLRDYIKSKGIEIGKKVAYASANDAERSGIREALQSEAANKLLQNDKISREFTLLNTFLKGLSLGDAYRGIESIETGLKEYKIGAILVNDSVINDKEIKKVLDTAYSQNVSIKIFNSEDDAGIQLKNFGNLAAIGKRLMKLNA